jgi:hypothetical protein
MLTNLIDLSQTNTIPETPGVYVWYVRPQIGRLDWQASFDGLGTDKGDEALRTVLYEFTRSMAPPELSTSTRLAFRDEWSGTLRADVYDENAKKLLKKTPEDDYSFPGQKFDKTLARESMRRALSELLDESAVTFWTPIYIGKSKDLRRRLSEHINIYRRVYDSTQQRPELQEQIAAGMRDPTASPNLAIRLIHANIRPDQCRIAYLSTLREGSNTDEADQLAEVLEWLLNTWNRPTLGKN